MFLPMPISEQPFYVLVQFLQLNGYHFSFSAEEAADMCVTIVVGALTEKNDKLF